MHLIQIPKLQALKDAWEHKKPEWLIKHNSTFANVNTDHYKMVAEYVSDPERVAKYYEERGKRDV